MQESPEFVGVIPMAGTGSRLGDLPFSKELYPIRTSPSAGSTEPGYPVPISELLIRQMILADIGKLHIVLRKGKWDIPAHYMGGTSRGISIAYHLADNESGVPFSIDQVYPFVKDCHVVMGFPDIFMKPETACRTIAEALKKDGSAMAALALFEVDDPCNWDVAELDGAGYVKRIKIKSRDATGPGLGWTLAAWKPVFSEYLNRFLKNEFNWTEDSGNPEPQFSQVLNCFIRAGNKVRGVRIEGGSSIDLGTPRGLRALDDHYDRSQGNFS